MEAGITVFYQIIKMFTMIAVGYLLYKKKIITDPSTAVFIESSFDGGNTMYFNYILQSGILTGETS